MMCLPAVLVSHASTDCGDLLDPSPDRVRSESRRVNASLQTVTRERDAARSELAETSAQVVGLAALRAQLQRAEAATSDAEQGREEARVATAASVALQDKLRTQLVRRLRK